MSASKENDESKSRKAGMISVDFKTVFPHVIWVSDWVTNPKCPEGFRLKILSQRNESEGKVEIVVVQEEGETKKHEIMSFVVPVGKFNEVSNDLIKLYEQNFSVQFEKMDMSMVKSSEEFGKRIKEGGGKIW